MAAGVGEQLIALQAHPLDGTVGAERTDSAVGCLIVDAFSLGEEAEPTLEEGDCPQAGGLEGLG